MKKKYVFLTQSIGGVAGGPSYVKNKCEWLQKNGWDVFAFDQNGKSEIVYETLLPFKDNRMDVLFYNPVLFSTRFKKRVFKKISKKIDYRNDDFVVVESNTDVLAEWGECYSEWINAKHVVYLIAENEQIKYHDKYEYYKFKLERNELFLINTQAVTLLFSKYQKIDEPNKYYWNANSPIAPVMTEYSPFDHINTSDIVITLFGRNKPYFPYVLKEIAGFANTYRSFEFVLLIVGNGYERNSIISQLKGIKNIKVEVYKALFPVPKNLFDKSDVVIANAGCAVISFQAGVKTITMDVENNKPLGLLGYTTKEITYANKDENYDSSLSQIISEILISKKYPNVPLFNPFETATHGYDYQISFINNEKNYWKKPLTYHKHDNHAVDFCYQFIAGKLHLFVLLRLFRICFY